MVGKGLAEGWQDIVNVLFPLKVRLREKDGKKQDIYRSHPLLLFPFSSS